MRMTVDDPKDIQNFLIENGSIRIFLTRSEEKNKIFLTTDFDDALLDLRELEVLGEFLLSIASTCYGTSSKDKIKELS